MIFFVNSNFRWNVQEQSNVGLLTVFDSLSQY